LAVFSLKSIIEILRFQLALPPSNLRMKGFIANDSF
jgi:hypothetical protein